MALRHRTSSFHLTYISNLLKYKSKYKRLLSIINSNCFGEIGKLKKSSLNSHKILHLLTCIVFALRKKKSIDQFCCELNSVHHFHLFTIHVLVSTCQQECPSSVHDTQDASLPSHMTAKKTTTKTRESQTGGNLTKRLNRTLGH